MSLSYNKDIFLAPVGQVPGEADGETFFPIARNIPDPFDFILLRCDIMSMWPYCMPKCPAGIRRKGI